MKVKCRTEVAEETPKRSYKRKTRDEVEVGTSDKRQKMNDGTRTRRSEDEGNGQLIQEWGEKIADAINGVGDQISDLNRTMQESCVAQRGMLGQLQRMVWMEDRIRTSLHLLTRNVGLLVEAEGNPVIGVVRDQEGEQVGKRVDKGKGKEVEREVSEESEESELEEDVVKGLEISTLDVDESMEAEKEV